MQCVWSLCSIKLEHHPAVVPLFCSRGYRCERKADPPAHQHTLHNTARHIRLPMSFFGRALLTGALVMGIVHVFRRDLTRIIGALRAPTQHFIKEVQRELEEKKTEGSNEAGAGALPPSSSASSATPESARLGSSSAGVISAAAAATASAPGASVPPLTPPGAPGVSPPHPQQPPAPREPELK